MTQEEILKQIKGLQEQLDELQGYFSRKTGVGGNITGPIYLQNFTVASLPTVGVSPGYLAYATDGRKNGEGAGSGTGVVVFRDSSAWRACDTGATVAA